MTERSCRFLRLAATLALLAPPVAFPAHGELLPVRTYTTLDGLAHNRVKMIREDGLGFLWFCTTEGLSRFDGREFVNYGIAEGLPVPSTNDLLASGEGAWVATNGGGVAWFEPAAPSPRFRPLAVGVDGGSRVNVLHLDPSGTLWAGTDGGLFRMARGRTWRPDAAFERVPLGVPGQPEETVMVWAFLETDAGVLVGTRFGLMLVSPAGEVRRIPVAPGGADTVAALARAGDGRILAGLLRGGLAILDPKTFAVTGRMAEPDGLPGPSVTAILVTPGRVLLGSEDGLVVLEGPRVTAWGTREGLPNSRIIAIAEDGDGGIWLATPGSGVVRVSLSGNALFQESDGLGSIVSAVFLRRNGEICAASSNWTLSRPEGRGFASIRPRLPAGLDEVSWRVYHGVLEDHEGGFWLASRQGLVRFAPALRLEQLARAAPVAVYTTRDGLSSDDLSRLFEDSRGDIWIGTFGPAREPLTRYRRSSGRFERFGEADGLPALGSPYRFAEDAAGNVWISYRDGTLARFRGGRFRVVSGRNGIPIAPVGGFALDRRGRLWATTFGKGLMRFDEPDADDPGVFLYGAAEGISAFHLGELALDGDDRVVFTTSRELMRLDPATGAISEVRAARGVLSTEATGACRDREGRLWFASWNGLARLSGGPAKPVRPPAVRVSATLVSGEARPVSGLGELVLDLGELSHSATLSLDFFGLGRPGEPLLYEHLLEGFERTWSERRKDRTVHFDHLAAGSYRFLVRSVALGGESSEPAVVKFEVLPPFWRRWWFLSGLALLLTGTGYAVEAARWRRRRELDAVRTRIASDLHDDLGASLSRISILSEVASRRTREGGSPAELVEKIGEASRTVVEKLADGIWAVDPRRDDLRSLGERLRLTAAELLEPAGISWRVEVPEGAERVGMHPDQRRNVYLLLKEAMANAARHSHAQNATLVVASAHGVLDLELRDDGLGFDAGAVGTGTRLVGGRGLRNMEARARALGGTLRVESVPGRGTLVSLRLRARPPA